MQHQSVEQRAAEVEQAVARAIAAHDEVGTQQGIADAWTWANPEPCQSETYADAEDMAELAEARETWAREYGALRRDVRAAESLPARGRQGAGRDGA